MIIKTTDHFDKEVKRLSKKYASIKKDLAKLVDSLSQNPRQGDRLREMVFKVRMAIESKNKGKSGGARVITYLIEIEKKEETDEETLWLLAIYDKSDFESLPDKLIDALIEEAAADYIA